MDNNLITTQLPFVVNDLEKPLTDKEKLDIFNYLTKQMYAGVRRIWDQKGPPDPPFIYLSMYNIELTHNCKNPTPDTYLCPGGCDYTGYPEFKMRDLLIRYIYQSHINKRPE